MDLQKRKKLTRALILGMSLILIIDLFFHIKNLGKTPAIPLPTVMVSHPKTINMATYVTQTGNTVAFNAVNLVARVAGYLEEINFTDGTDIKKDTELFVIEPQPYMEKLLEAKATLAAALADLEYTTAEYKRQQRMYKENATSLNNVEIWLAKSHESSADVDKAKANVSIAEINYSYTHIKAPFNGRIGRHLVDLNNLVGNGVATTLATIEQIDPLYVYFNLNELDLLKLRKAARKYGYTEKTINQVPVTVTLQNSNTVAFKGNLDFVNTGLNASMGTMELRAILTNKKHLLVPGLFVQVRVAITKPTPQFTVPDSAVLYDQIGAYLLLVDPNNTVALRRVTLGNLEDNNRAILTSLSAKDNVIVNGLQNATPGNKVTVQYENNIS